LESVGADLRADTEVAPGDASDHVRTKSYRGVVETTIDACPYGSRHCSLKPNLRRVQLPHVIWRKPDPGAELLNLAETQQGTTYMGHFVWFLVYFAWVHYGVDDLPSRT
jgi:hypothetical protein